MLKFTATCLSALLLFSSIGATSPAIPAFATDKTSVYMITDPGGLDDHGFNDSAWMGLAKFERDAKGLRTAIKPTSLDDIIPNVTDGIDKKNDLIIGVGFLMNNSFQNLAQKYPEQHFAVIDTVVDAPNVASAVFKEEEGSYLAGVVAGLATKTNKVGFVAGIEMPLISKFEYGFRAGVASVNPKATVYYKCAKTFSDVEVGVKLAKELKKSGVDVIYSAAGAVGTGIAKSAENEKLWVIGVDTDQNDLAPKNTLCSMVKHLDVATYTFAMDEYKGKFKGGLYTFGLKENGVGLSDHGKRLTPATYKVINLFKAGVVSGKIKVPSTKEAFETFKAPNIKFTKPKAVTQ